MCFGIIYRARNKINGKQYIGQTTKKLSDRIIGHFKKEKKEQSFFQLALHKYGLENFDWDILFEAKNKQELDEKEQFFIEEYETLNREKGYNLKTGGVKTSFTNEVKEKMSQSAKAYFSLEENRINHGLLQKKDLLINLKE